MHSVALYLAVGMLAKEMLWKDWHWGISQKLRDPFKAEDSPAPSLRKGGLIQSA